MRIIHTIFTINIKNVVAEISIVLSSSELMLLTSSLLRRDVNWIIRLRINQSLFGPFLRNPVFPPISEMCLVIVKRIWFIMWERPSIWLLFPLDGMNFSLKKLLYGWL